MRTRCSGVSIPRGTEPQETHAYSLEGNHGDASGYCQEPRGWSLQRPASRGRGALKSADSPWQDYEPASNGRYGEIRVERSVWGTRVQPTKTRRSRAAVPVIPHSRKSSQTSGRNAGIRRPGSSLKESGTESLSTSTQFAKCYIEPVLSANGQQMAMVASIPAGSRDEPPPSRRGR